MGLAIEAGSAAVLVGSFLLRAAAPPAICIAIPAASAALASLALSVLALAFPISSFSALSILGLVTLARSPSSGGSRLASAGALGVIGDLDAEGLDRLGQVGGPVLATGLVQHRQFADLLDRCHLTRRRGHRGQQEVPVAPLELIFDEGLDLGAQGAIE